MSIVARQCSICVGEGVVEKDGKLYECECSELRRIYSTMPVYIHDAPVRMEHASLPVLKMIDRSVRLMAYRDDMNAIVKLMLIKHRKKFIRITDDKTLIDVWLGKVDSSDKYEVNGKLENPTLGDIVNPSDLLIIETNSKIYKNKAAPGVLEECMCQRMNKKKPVWLLSYMDRPFDKTSPASSDGVWSLIHHSMTTVTVPLILPASTGSGAVTSNGGNLQDSPLSPEPVETRSSKDDGHWPDGKKKTRRQTIASAPDVDSPEMPPGFKNFGSGVNRKPGRSS